MSRPLETTKLSSKGQVVLPRAIRVAKSWRPGQALEVLDTADGVLLKPLKPFRTSTLEQVVGCLPHKGKPLTLAQMDAAVRAEGRRRK